MFGLGKKEPKAPKLPKCQAAINMNHLEGLETVPYNERIGLVVYTGESDLEIEFNKNKMLLPLNQIVSVNIITWEKTIVKALNPMAEGLVGGMIGGHTMAVVSAIDAKGRTRSEKVKVERAVEIHYHPKENLSAIKCMVFSSHLTRNDTVKWVKTLCKYAELPDFKVIPQKPQGPQYL